LLHIGEKHLAVHRAHDDARRGHSALPQAAHEGDRFPMFPVARSRPAVRPAARGRAAAP
jgi:hypothetical protein